MSEVLWNAMPYHTEVYVTKWETRVWLKPPSGETSLTVIVYALTSARYC